MARVFLGAIIGAVVAAAVVWPAPASAMDDKDTCFKASGDVAIAACTRRIAVLSRSRDANARHNLAVVHYSRGYELLAKGELKRAMADFEVSWKTDPSYARALYGRGLVKKRLGDASGGAADIAHALKIEPSLANE